MVDVFVVPVLHPDVERLGRPVELVLRVSELAVSTRNRCFYAFSTRGRVYDRVGHLRLRCGRVPGVGLIPRFAFGICRTDSGVHILKKTSQACTVGGAPSLRTQLGRLASCSGGWGPVGQTTEKSVAPQFVSALGRFHLAILSLRFVLVAELARAKLCPLGHLVVRAIRPSCSPFASRTPEYLPAT